VLSDIGVGGGNISGLVDTNSKEETFADYFNDESLPSSPINLDFTNINAVPPIK
jgi:hypothetical protein